MLENKTAMFLSPKAAHAGSNKVSALAKALPFVALMALPADAAFAGGAKDNVALQFDVYAGSLRIFKISMGMEIDDRDYAIHTRIKSKGLASLFAKTKVNMSAAGRRQEGIVPLNYSSKSKTKGKKRSIRMSWNGKGKQQVKRSFDLNSFKSKNLARVVRPGMVDPLSYLMKMVARPAKQPCNSTERVYDGRHVAEYRYAFEGVSTFNRSTGGVYRGKAFKCSLKYRTIAGLSAQKQKVHDKKPPSSFTIWFARVEGQGRNLFVPIAASGQLSGRAFTMRLSDGSVSGQPISKRVLATN